MSQHLTVVVGDKFETFAHRDNVTTVARLAKDLDSICCPGNQVVLLRGQGLSNDSLREARQIVAESNFAESIDLSRFPEVLEHAPARLSHKRYRRNRMVSVPRRVDDSNFRLDLLIDEDCEFMGDHQTGQHIQGMILVEAGRQAFLAVSEKYYLSSGGCYFVIDEISVKFKAFAFPVPASIEYRVNSVDYKRSDRPKFSVSMSLRQYDNIAMSMDVVFSVFQEAEITVKESELASDLINRVIQQHTNGGAVANDTYQDAAAE